MSERFSIENFIYVYIYVYGMSKLVNLSDYAYDELKQRKLPGESFSDVVNRLVEKKKPLLEFLGKWPGSSEEIDKIKSQLEKERKDFSTREVKF